MSKLHQIGEVAQMLDISNDTLRYYEKIGLLKNIYRNQSGNREYSEKDLSQIRFIQRAQLMNFRLSEIESLLAMREDPFNAKQEIRELTIAKLDDITEKLNNFTLLHNELSLLVNLCQKNDDCNCPIIEKLNGKKEK